MDDRSSFTTNTSAKGPSPTRPDTPVSRETGTNHNTRSGGVRIYDRPKGTLRSWLSIIPVLLSVIFIALILVLYFFMSS
jgi:hypothetical protein